MHLIKTNFENKTFLFSKRSELKVIYDKKLRLK